MNDEEQRQRQQQVYERWLQRLIAAALITGLLMVVMFTRNNPYGWHQGWRFEIGEGFGALDSVGLFAIALVLVMALERLLRK